MINKLNTVMQYSLCSQNVKKIPVSRIFVSHYIWLLSFWVSEFVDNFISKKISFNFLTISRITIEIFWKCIGYAQD